MQRDSLFNRFKMYLMIAVCKNIYQPHALMLHRGITPIVPRNGLSDPL